MKVTARLNVMGALHTNDGDVLIWKGIVLEAVAVGARSGWVDVG